MLLKKSLIFLSISLLLAVMMSQAAEPLKIAVPEDASEAEQYAASELKGYLTKIDGMIVCSNTVADVGLEAVEIFRKWAVLHGGETR